MASAAAENTNGAFSSKTENGSSAVSESTNKKQRKQTNFRLMDSLYQAAAGGEISEFRKHEGRLHELSTPKGNTILHIHITSRSRKVTRSNLFTRKKPKTEIKGEDDNAFLRNILDLCSDLLWQPNNKKETLLHMAARHGHADIVELVIEECEKRRRFGNDQETGIGATRMMLSSTNVDKDTALHEAVRYNYADVVKVLIEKDGNLPYEANNYGETPLYLAVERGFTEIANLILETSDSPAAHGPNGRTALHAAAIVSNSSTKSKVMQNLLAKMGDLTDKADEDGFVPLHYAAYIGSPDSVRQLLRANVSSAYEADNQDGVAPVHLAAGLGSMGIMHELMSNCPGCYDLVDRHGRNALHFAVKSENRKAIQLILQNPLLGNLINERDNKGNTPLLQHAASGSYIRSFIRHPKVDKQVFNYANHNAVSIVTDNELLLDEQYRRVRWLDDLHAVNRTRSKILVPKHKNGEDDDDDDDDKNHNDKKDKEKVGRGNVLKDAKETHLIVATLIATVTFTAGFTVPGGYIDDKGPEQGTAILARSSAFQAFVIFNTLAMITSSSAVFIHTYVPLASIKRWHMLLIFTSWKLTSFAMMTMVCAFVTGTYAVLNHSPELAISTCIIGLYVGVYVMRPIKSKFPVFHWCI